MEAFLSLIFLTIGVFMIFYGIRLKKGFYKIWYMKPWVRAGSNIYTLIPVGITAFLWGIIGLLVLTAPKDNITLKYLTLILGIISIGSIIVGILLAFFFPDHMKPYWLKWLEGEHKDILPILRKEANQLGYPTWDNLVKTQADLENWVAEVRRKHGL